MTAALRHEPYLYTCRKVLSVVNLQEAERRHTNALLQACLHYVTLLEAAVYV
jgi:hypothetical protein